ncbi:T-cell surface glycoprotein CD3 epsilon chain-like [Vanacampus margaritifer]
MYNGALLFCHLLIVSAVEAGTGGVTFWRENFTMTCPENGAWFQRGEQLHKSSNSLTLNGKNKGLYYCEYDKDNIKYYFYVEGKVCTHCFELDAVLFGVLIVADVSVTIALMILIYKCTKKKISLSTKDSAVPSSDYDQLNTHARSQDPYSFLNSGRSK